MLRYIVFRSQKQNARICEELKSNYEAIPRIKIIKKTMKPGFIYILTNKNNTTLYVGVTSHIVQRINQHKDKIFPESFSAKYNLNKLVYYEAFQEIGDAIGREKQIKGGSRQKKLDLINSKNPEWKDLYDEIVENYSNLNFPF